VVYCSRFADHGYPEFSKRRKINGQRGNQRPGKKPGRASG